MSDPSPSSARTLRAIAILKWLKAAALIAVGIGLLQAEKHGLLASMAHSLRSPVLDRAFTAGVNWLASLSAPMRWLLDLGTFLYAALFAIEGIGLWMRKRWAEWLTVVTTSLLIPIELYEIVHKPSVERVTLMVINVAIAIYLVIQLRQKDQADPSE